MPVLAVFILKGVPRVAGIEGSGTGATRNPWGVPRVAGIEGT